MNDSEGGAPFGRKRRKGGNPTQVRSKNQGIVCTAASQRRTVKEESSARLGLKSQMSVRLRGIAHKDGAQA